MVGARSQPRNPHISGLPTPQSAVTRGSKIALRRPLRTTTRPYSAFSGYLPAYGGQNSHATSTNCLGQHRFVKNNPRQVFTQEARPSRVTDLQPWRCVNMFCDTHRNLQVYTTCDGWKRHMKEHETDWPCMPYGPFETAGTGLICALCGSMNPSESHMADHSIGECGDTSAKRRGVSRRANLEGHLLRSHGVSDNRTRGLADKWKRTLRKKHYACGFCVCIFSTILEQLNHIDMDHFRKGQLMNEWSATNVIRGLLLSPTVASSFQHLLSSDHFASDRDLHWDRDMIEDLQRRLEMAEDAAETLAFAAYRMLAFNLSRQNSNGQYTQMILSGLNFIGQGEGSMGFFADPAESLEMNSKHQIVEVAQGSEHPWSLDGNHIAAPSTSCLRPTYGLALDRSDAPEAQISMEFQGAYPLAPGGFPTVSASSATRSQPVCSQIQIQSASSLTEFTSSSGYDSSGTSTHWKAAPSITPSPLQSAGAAGMLGEQSRTYHGPTRNTKTAGTLPSDLDDRAQSSSWEGGLFFFDTCDPRDLIKNSR